MFKGNVALVVNGTFRIAADDRPRQSLLKFRRQAGKGGLMQHWLFLAGAIALEVAGTTAMKLSEGFTRLVPSVLLFVFYAASFVALTFALKKIEVSVAYAVWSGIGTALIAAIGILYFREEATALKFISILLIIIGVVGLNLGGAKQ
jgi:small multidrug resistance pump